MTYWKETEIIPKSSPYTSTSDRLRTTIPRNLFENRFKYDTQDLLWEEVESVNGSIIHLPNENGARLQIGGNSGDKYVRQTKEYFTYSSGKTIRAKNGVRLSPDKEGIRERTGLFEAENGYYFEKVSGEYYFVRRSSASGSIVEERVPQSEWNVDKLDGSGPSKVVLDMEKVQMPVFKNIWYGGGTPAVGFEIGEEIFFVHKFQGANNLYEVVIGNPSLPLRHEIENIQATGENSNLDIFGGTIIVDGDDDIPGYNFSADNDVNPVTVLSTDLTLVLAIKPRLQFKGFDNRSKVEPLSVEALAQANNDIVYRVIRNPTFSASPSFNEVETDSSVLSAEGDGSITVIGGSMIQSGYVGVGANISRNVKSKVNSRVPLTINHDATVADTLVVAAKGVGGSAPVLSSINWKEIY